METFGKISLAILATVASIFLSAYVWYFAVNEVISQSFNFPQITLFQGWVISLLKSTVFARSKEDLADESETPAAKIAKPIVIDLFLLLFWLVTSWLI